MDINNLGTHLNNRLLHLCGSLAYIYYRPTSSRYIYKLLYVPYATM